MVLKKEIYRIDYDNHVDETGGLADNRIYIFGTRQLRCFSHENQDLRCQLVDFKIDGELCYLHKKDGTVVSVESEKIIYLSERNFYEISEELSPKQKALFGKFLLEKSEFEESYLKDVYTAYNIVRSATITEEEDRIRLVVAYRETCFLQNLTSYSVNKVYSLTFNTVSGFAYENYSVLLPRLKTFGKRPKRLSISAGPSYNFVKIPQEILVRLFNMILDKKTKQLGFKPNIKYPLEDSQMCLTFLVWCNYFPTYPFLCDLIAYGKGSKGFFKKLFKSENPRKLFFESLKLKQTKTLNQYFSEDYHKVLNYKFLKEIFGFKNEDALLRLSNSTNLFHFEPNFTRGKLEICNCNIDLPFEGGAPFGCNNDYLVDYLKLLAVVYTDEVALVNRFLSNKDFYAVMEFTRMWREVLRYLDAPLNPYSSTGNPYSSKDEILNILYKLLKKPIGKHEHDTISNILACLNYKEECIAYTKDEIGLELTRNDYRLRLPDTTRELLNTSNEMSICVKTYAYSVVHKHCTIAIVYDNSDDSRVCCIEIQKIKDSNKLKVVQVKGCQNSISFSDKLHGFISDWVLKNELILQTADFKLKIIA